MGLNILLEKNKSKNSVNVENFVNLDLTSKSRLLPYNDISDTLNLTKLYQEERDNSTKYRLLFTVNPICSNVLYNMRTEVVREEGSDECIFVPMIFDSNGVNNFNAINKTPLWSYQATRDTEYSHPDLMEGTPYVYHCGADIFNNHMLRARDFVFVNKIEEGDTGNTKFNTISDYLRNGKGEIVKEYNYGANDLTTKDEENNNVFNNNNLINLHLYQTDSVLEPYQAFKERINEENGWFGFINQTTVSIPNASIEEGNENTKNIVINRIMNNNKSCEQYDMYPDRSLFSFIPKYNKYRHRQEKNWDYCITYPYMKDFEKINEVCGCNNSSVKIVEAIRTYSNSGNNLIRMKSIFKHNLDVNDVISLYYLKEDSMEHISRRITVVGIGDYEGNDKEHYFSVKYSEIEGVFGICEETGCSGEYLTLDNEKAQLFFKKETNGIEHQYYFRKFKKIKREDNKELDSYVNKLAYGENIYGDRIAQVIYTDDIDIDGLVDHNGKPLSELYFTIIKRNAGHSLWYDENVYTGDSIEFSHCFGKVTDGLDLPVEQDDYNIKYLHNIDYETWDLKPKSTLSESNDITIEDDVFWGDVVDYNPYDDSETVLNPVYFRFNTAQRETKNDIYSAFNIDLIRRDDYDINSEGESVPFAIENRNLAEIDDDNNYLSNLNPEGYYYLAHTKIQIKDISETINKVRGDIIRYTDYEVNGNVVTINGAVEYKLLKNDFLGFYDGNKKKTYWGTITGITGNIIKVVTSEEIPSSNCQIISTKESVPIYATYLPTSHSFVWRSVLPYSEISSNSALYNMPFANGCHYIHSNVNLFVRRQDPTGKYGLMEANRILNRFIISGWDPVDFSIDRYFKDNIGQICV